MDVKIETSELNVNASNVAKIYPELEDLVITPTSEEQNFKSNKYGYNKIKVKAIEKEEQPTVTATAEDIAEGKTAYINGELVTGSIEEIKEKLVLHDIISNPPSNLLDYYCIVQGHQSNNYSAMSIITSDVPLFVNTIYGTIDFFGNSNIKRFDLVGSDFQETTAQVWGSGVGKHCARNGEVLYSNHDIYHIAVPDKYNIGSNGELYFAQNIDWAIDYNTFQSCKLKDDLYINGVAINNDKIYRLNSKIGIIIKNADFSALAEAINLKAEIIKEGETVLGITGTYTGE